MSLVNNSDNIYNNDNSDNGDNSDNSDNSDNNDNTDNIYNVDNTDNNDNVDNIDNVYNNNNACKFYLISIKEIKDLDNMLKLKPQNKIEKAIFKYKNKISKFNSNAYKYGNGWFDYWLIKRVVKKLNVILIEYNIQVIL